MIARMQKLRNSTHIARLVLVWFALFIGVAIASPLVHPQTVDLVCTSAGGMKLVSPGDADSAGAGAVGHHSLNCPLCAHLALPLADFQTLLTQPSPLARALQPIVAAHIAALTTPPLPSRGPPVISL